MPRYLDPDQARAASNAAFLFPFSIASEPAHDAVVYPVIGGTGWEGGFGTIVVEMENPEEEEEGTIDCH